MLRNLARTRLARRLLHYGTSLLNRLHDRYWEARLGIETTRDAPSPHSDAHRYGYVAYHTYFAILDALQLKPSDGVVDLGCGKGRVVCAAATYNIAAAIGVEIDPALCAQAEANAARFVTARAPVRFVCQSAVDFDYDPITVAILFHPFGRETWNLVLDRIHKSLAARPRAFRLVSINPEYSDVLDGQLWLERYDAWTPEPWSRLKFPVHFYRHAPDASQFSESAIETSAAHT